MALFHSEWLGAGEDGAPAPPDFRHGYGNRLASTRRFGPTTTTGRRSAPSPDPAWRAAQSSAITRSANSEHFTSVALSISRAKS